MNTVGNTAVARLRCNEATARRLADSLSEHSDLSEAAVAAFEGTDGSWNLEVHFETAPDEAAVRRLIGAAGGAAADVTFETIAARDWVAASLADLKPVTAGRFTVHGAHDRPHVTANRIGIEIEAALAFGTGHHGTTRGCLPALGGVVRRASPTRARDRTPQRHRAVRAVPARRRPCRAGLPHARAVRPGVRQYPAGAAQAPRRVDAAAARAPGPRRAVGLARRAG